MISIEVLTVLVWLAIGVCALTPVLLLALAWLDNRQEDLW